MKKFIAALIVFAVLMGGGASLAHRDIGSFSFSMNNTSTIGINASSSMHARYHTGLSAISYPTSSNGSKQSMYVIMNETIQMTNQRWSTTSRRAHTYYDDWADYLDDCYYLGGRRDTTDTTNPVLTSGTWCCDDYH